ncbi:MAG: glycosyltransferase family 1 protein [Candidatus Baltobacteraceae bacterium]
MTRQMSVGMKAYASELTARLPQAAPDLEFIPFRDGRNFSIAEQIELPRAMKRAKVDLCHFLSLYTPALPPRPYIITIHDVIHLRYPQYFKKRVMPYYQTVVRLAANRAARVITDDERTVADLERFLGVDPARCRVVPLGVGELFSRPVTPHRGERPYFLYVGNHRPHKNLETLLAAWRDLAGSPCDLYLTGADDFPGGLAQYNREAARVVPLGEVAVEHLVELYAGACGLIAPSLSEGFGLPMLEAMAAGCPVIASDTAAPRILSPAILTVPPTDRSALRAAMQSVRDEGLRADLVNQGRELAGRLSWDRCAVRTADVYREVLEEGRR